MFFILSKTLGILTQPLFWIVLFLFVAYFTKKPKLRKWSKRLFIGSALFFTNTVVLLEFMRMWEMEGTRIEDVGNYDVAVVLGGMAEYDNNLERLSIRRGGDRIWQAITLYKSGKVNKLLISGANGYVADDPLNEAVQFKEVLILQGIPAEDILIDSLSKNTHQNAVESLKILEKHPEIESVLLVTSAWHMRRSRACFEKAGFDNFDCFTTDHFTGEKEGMVGINL